MVTDPHHRYSEMRVQEMPSVAVEIVGQPSVRAVAGFRIGVFDCERGVRPGEPAPRTPRSY